MLEGLFGNKSAEKVMLSIFNHGELHASAIAQMHNTALDPIKKQLERFEEAGFLISRVVGRSRLYKFNNQNPMIKPLKQLLLIAKKGEGRDLVGESIQ
jgi:predicted transcriptional regulator